MSAPASDAAATRAEAKARAAEALALGELLACRAYLYELFHKLFGGEPDAELLDVLLGAVTADAVDAYAADDETMAALQRFLAGLAAREHRPVLLEEAHDEYMRLFIGPGTLPTLPWESPYRTNEPSVFQEGTLAVRALYRAHGVEPKLVQRVPDDHVSLLCAFAARQADAALEAFRASDMMRSAALLREQQAFASEHLAGWLPAYAKRARRSRTAVLYPQMIEALCAFSVLDAAFASEGACWMEAADGADGNGGVDGDWGAVPGSPEAEALAMWDAARARLATLQPRGIEENELVSIER